MVSLVPIALPVTFKLVASIKNTKSACVTAGKWFNEYKSISSYTVVVLSDIS